MPWAEIWGTGGRSPHKTFDVGTARASVPPNILRSTVIGCEANYELTKIKGVKEEFFSLKLRLLVKKRAIYVIYQLSDSRDSIMEIYS